MVTIVLVAGAVRPVRPGIIDEYLRPIFNEVKEPPALRAGADAAAAAADGSANLDARS